MSSVFNIPEVLALAISLVSAPLDGDAKSGPGVVDFNPVVARQMLATYRQGRRVHWSELQYTSQTWLQAVKAGGAQFGYGRYAARVFQTRMGRYYVPLAGERRAILRLRRDVVAAFLLTGKRLAGLSATLAARLGRRPKPAELLMARKFGVDAAARIIDLANKHPSVLIAARLPRLAFQNTGLFFGKKRVRTAREIYRIVSRAYASTSRRAKIHAGWTAAKHRYGARRGSKVKVTAALRQKLKKANSRLNFTGRNVRAALQWDRLFRDRRPAAKPYSIAKLLH